MKKLNSKGFTLTEVLAAITLSLIITLALSSFVSAFGNIYSATRERNEKQLMMSITKEYLKSQLAHAQNITPSGGEGHQRLEFKNGRIYKNADLVFDEDFYAGYQIAVTASGQGSAINFSAGVFGDDGSLEDEFAVKTLNTLNIDMPDPVGVIYFN